jgi:hypothetical protein
MYLQSLYIENVGPLEKLSLNTQFTSEGKPVPLIFVGKNGSGKTNLLSMVADSFFEAASAHYRDVVPNMIVQQRDWFRIVGGVTVMSGRQFNCTLMRFSEGEDDYFYIDKAGTLNIGDISERVPADLRKCLSWNPEQNVKQFDLKSEISKKIFESGVYVFFPSNRSDPPSWLNKNSLPSDLFDIGFTYQGRLDKPIYAQTGLDKIKQWILSVMLDCKADYDIHEVKLHETLSHLSFTISGGFDPRQKKVMDSINLILQFILNDNSAKFVWQNRTSQQGLAISKDHFGTLIPVESLSSGQSTLLVIFATLLKYADKANGGLPMPDTIKGICIIDEIDAHIHTDLQYEILPKLFKLFPNVQFILSSHSPLFILGMTHLYGEDGIEIIDLPTGVPIVAESYSEFLQAFEVMRLTKKYVDSVIEHVKIGSNPIVFTEGETDVMYLKTAIELLGDSGLAGKVDIQSIGARDEESGQVVNSGKNPLSAAQNLLIAKPQITNRKVIFFYDNDVKNCSEGDYGNIYVRIMPSNIENVEIQYGIENVLPANVFEDRFYQEKEYNKGNGDKGTNRHLQKMELCRFLCEQKKDKTDFIGFEPVLATIREILGITS